MEEEEKILLDCLKQIEQEKFPKRQSRCSNIMVAYNIALDRAQKILLRALADTREKILDRRESNGRPTQKAARCEDGDRGQGENPFQ